MWILTGTISSTRFGHSTKGRWLTWSIYQAQNCHEDPRRFPAQVKRSNPRTVNFLWMICCWQLYHPLKTPRYSKTPVAEESLTLSLVLAFFWHNMIQWGSTGHMGIAIAGSSLSAGGIRDGFEDALALVFRGVSSRGRPLKPRIRLGPNWILVSAQNLKVSCWLVVWYINFIFPYIGNVIIPTDYIIFFRGVGQPPTSLGLRPWELENLDTLERCVQFPRHPSSLVLAVSEWGQVLEHLDTLLSI